MIRFLITLLIFWAIIWGLWSFFSPLNRVASTLENSQDEYTKILTEAIERNNPDAKNIEGLFSQNTNQSETEDSPSEEVSMSNTEEQLWNPAFAKRGFYNTPAENVAKYWTGNSWNSSSSSNIQYNNSNLDRENSRDSEKWTLYDPCLHWEENRWYFGTPPIPRFDTQAYSPNASSKQWWLIFDPALTLAAFPSTTGPLMYGEYTQILDFHHFF